MEAQRGRRFVESELGMTAGIIDTRNFSQSYENTQRRLAVLEQQISNPDIQIGQNGGGDAIFDSIVINNPGAGADVEIGFDVSPPTGLGAITSTYLDEVYIDASWTAAVGEVVEYEVEVARRTSPGVYDNARVYRTAGTTVRIIVPLGGVIYGIRVATINRLGIRSSFTSRIDVTTAVDSTIPGTISGLSVTGGVNSLVVTFNRLADADMQNGDGLYRIQLSSNDFSSILQDKYTSSNVEMFDGLTQGTNYKVRVAGIDPSGNQGPYTTSADTQAGYVTNSHIVANTINGDRISAATIQGAKIVAGSVDGDRITANTLDANRIKTSTLTAADITISGGSLIVGTPVTADGALLNSQGFKLYKDGDITVNLDALTGDATFTGDLVGTTMHGGQILSANIIGEGVGLQNIVPNGNFNIGTTGWTHNTGSGGFGLMQWVSSPGSPLNTESGEAPYVKLYQSGAASPGSPDGHSILSSDFIPVEVGEFYYFSAKYRINANSTASGGGSVPGGQYQMIVTFYTSADVYNGERSMLTQQLAVNQDVTDSVATGDFVPPINTTKIKIFLRAEFLEDGYMEIDDILVAKSGTISGLGFRSRGEGLPTVEISTEIQHGRGNHFINFIQGYDEPNNIIVPARIVSSTWSIPNAAGNNTNNFHYLKLQSGQYSGRREAYLELKSASPGTSGHDYDSQCQIDAEQIFLGASTSPGTLSASLSIANGRIALSGNGTAPIFTVNNVPIDAGTAKGRIFDSQTAGTGFWPTVAPFNAGIGGGQIMTFPSSSINFGTGRKYKISMYIRATAYLTAASLAIFTLILDGSAWSPFGHHIAWGAYEHINVSMITNLSGSHTIQVGFSVSAIGGGSTGMQFWRDADSYFMIEDIGPA